MTYLNIKENGKVETLDSFDTYKEAKKMIREYQLASDYYLGSYLSSRCTKEYKKEGK